MILGRIAVGAIIFSALAYFLLNLPEWASDGDDYTQALVAVIILIIALYCAISGTYLLYLGGKI